MKINVFPPDAAQLLRERERAAVYSADDDTARALFQAGPAAGFNVYRIDLSQARTPADLHRVLRKALHFPDWYGGDWPSLTDALTDLSWNEADGYLLILQRAEVLRSSDLAAHDALMAILKASVTTWAEQGVAFWVLFVGDYPELPTIGVRT